ncbi:transcription initiation factor IIF, beta subunit [Ostertagia ostertagi]
MSRKREHAVDCEMGKRGVWLVKVKLKSRPGLVLPASISSSLKGPAKIPDEHSFILGDVLNQTMAVLVQKIRQVSTKRQKSSEPGRLSIEGRVVKRAECRPPASSSYLKMKIAQISSSGQPKKQVLQMEKAAVKFKPVAAHAEDMMRIKQKKEGAKTVRADRNVLMQALFHAFEKHQYYRLQDLQQLTQQPAGYVKELLTEIAVYNTAPPHKSMWELKPEYRDYAVQKLDSLKVIQKFGKGAPALCGMPKNSAVHLQISDPLGEWRPGFNDTKSIAVFTKGGKRMLDPRMYREIVRNFMCDSFDTMLDYDVPRGSLNKRLSKAIDRTKTFYELVVDHDESPEGAVIVSLGGGFNDYYRRKCAVDVGLNKRCDGYSVDLREFTHGSEVDKEELKKLVEETFGPLPPTRFRFVSGPFDPAMVLYLVRLGFDCFDSSYAIKISEEAKCLRLADDYPYSSQFELLEFNDDKYAILSVMPLRRVDNETDLERQYREAREELNRWNSSFWERHNTLFDRRKSEFVQKRKKEIGRIEQISANDLSVFYKEFLDLEHANLMAYNKEWYRRNLALCWPALKVNMIRFMRLLKRS